MLHSLHAKNFDHFSDIDLKFGRVNVLTGENGSGKTNLLKLLYVVLAWDSAAEPSLDTLKLLLASEFRTRQVSSLCDIRLRRVTLDSRGFSFWWEGYSWKAKVQADAPCTPENQAPVFRITDLESDAEFTFGRKGWVFRPEPEQLPVVRLVENLENWALSLKDQSQSGPGYLLWDTPEAKLGPKLLRRMAKSMFDLGQSGVQVFLATHSLFLMRELEILGRDGTGGVRFFGLHRDNDGTGDVTQGGPSDIGPIAALDEELEQSGRYLNKQG